MVSFNCHYLSLRLHIQIPDISCTMISYRLSCRVEVVTFYTVTFYTALKTSRSCTTSLKSRQSVHSTLPGARNRAGVFKEAAIAKNFVGKTAIAKNIDGQTEIKTVCGNRIREKCLRQKGNGEIYRRQTETKMAISHGNSNLVQLCTCSRNLHQVMEQSMNQIEFMLEVVDMS